jgi:hypothetical protein
LLERRMRVGEMEASRARQARQAAERVGRDVRVIGRRGSTDTDQDIPILMQAVSDLAESVVSLAAAVEEMNRGG